MCLFKLLVILAFSNANVTVRGHRYNNTWAMQIYGDTDGLKRIAEQYGSSCKMKVNDEYMHFPQCINYNATSARESVDFYNDIWEIDGYMWTYCHAISIEMMYEDGNYFLLQTVEPINIITATLGTWGTGRFIYRVSWLLNTDSLMILTGHGLMSISMAYNMKTLYAKNQ